MLEREKEITLERTGSRAVYICLIPSSRNLGSPPESIIPFASIVTTSIPSPDSPNVCIRIAVKKESVPG